MKVLKYTREILITGLVLFVILLFVKPCGKAKDLAAYRLLEAQLANTKKEKQVIAKSLDSIFKKHAADSATWAGEKQLAVIETKEADIKVKQQQKTIDRLVAVIRNEPGKPDSSTMVLVTPAFKEACDSLPAEIDKLNRAIAEKDTAINEWSGLLAHEVQERDNTIESLRIEINKGKRLYDGLEKIAETAIARAKPRGRFMGGLSVIGSEEQFISGAGPVLAYQTKGGKQYQASAKAMKFPTVPKVTMFYEGTVLFTILK